MGKKERENDPDTALRCREGRRNVITRPGIRKEEKRCKGRGKRRPCSFPAWGGGVGMPFMKRGGKKTKGRGSKPKEKGENPSREGKTPQSFRVQRREKGKGRGTTKREKKKGGRSHIYHRRGGGGEPTQDTHERGRRKWDLEKGKGRVFSIYYLERMGGGKRDRLPREKKGKKEGHEKKGRGEKSFPSIT